MMSAHRLIVALDYTSAPPALQMARQLRGLVHTVKIGSALFTACGPSVITRIRSLGFQVMLDLKFFDIPSTVELSCRAAVHHRVSLVTIHAAGERGMLEGAVRGIRAESRRIRGPRPKLLAVTVLTSQGRRSDRAMRAQVCALARAARAAGCDGVVASAQEAGALRRTFGRRLHIVCPGIRPAPTPQVGGAGRKRPVVWGHDQQRICTPGEALAAGADALVIGRPITGSRRPREAVQHILHEMGDRHRC